MKQNYVAMLVFACVVSACSEGNEFRELAPHNVVLVTIDTLRADHLGCYGYPRSSSPFIDSLAEDGILFERMISTSATTSPAHASIFTGQYPLQHGIRKNGGGRLLDHVQTVAERYAAEGWATAAFVGISKSFRVSGFDRGFEIFDDPVEKEPRQAEQTATEVLEWLDNRDDTRPLFLWLHFWDVHAPYAPVELYESGSAENAEAFVEFVLEQHSLDMEFFENDKENLLALMNAYDGEIQAVDSALERVFHGLQASQPESETIAIVTADHGEGLGNHDWLVHGKHIYNEQLRIPLIVYSFQKRLKPARIAEVATHVDLYPTLLDLLGEDEELLSSDFEGVSLGGLIDGYKELTPQRFAFSERRHYSERDEKTLPSAFSAARNSWSSLRTLSQHAARYNYEPGETFSVQNRRYKYIFSSAHEDQLFDLERDPYERTNLIGQGLEVEEILRRAIQAHLEEKKAEAPEQDFQPDPEVLEALKALGYVP